MSVVRFKQASIPKVYRMNRVPRMSGFTMMELLIVITIVAILAGIGAPSFRNITTSYRIAGEVNGLLGDMQFARAEAVKEGQNVTICVSSNGTSCSGSTAWQNGWTVFPVVSTAPTAAQSAATVLRVQSAFSGSDTFVDHTSGTSTVTFDRNGLISGLNSGNGALIALRDPTSKVLYTRCLQISSVGSLQITQNTTNGSCT
jgi:type IV fimbrial biogenesis protein FimT